MELAIMIEGQNGLNWPRWQRIAQTVEGLGYAGLYRSDHFTNANPPDIDSLEMWTSLTWLASHTQRIEFGPLVSPVSFRHPAITARTAASVDDLSGGRLTLGLGAGWQEREHEHFGFDLLPIDQRFQRFEEGLEVVTRLLHSDQPVDFEGQYFCLFDAVLLPRPQRPGGPPILIGGNGRKRTLPLAARFAQEWNAVQATPQQLKELNQELDRLLLQAGRKTQDVKRSLMTGCIYGKDQAELDRKLAKRQRTQAELQERGVLVGSLSEFSDQIELLAHSGVQRIMLQWMDLEDMEGIKSLSGLI